MSGSAIADLTLPAEPRSAGRARRAVRAALEEAGGEHLGEGAELVVSELVTNAVVHAGTQVRVHIVAAATTIRVEIEDGSARLPIRRWWADTAGTGRGLRIVDEHADRWAVERTDNGKVVWFEIGDPTTATATTTSDGAPGRTHARRPPERVAITLLHVPLLMHWAWQEHAATLLREYLLYKLDHDPRVLDDHVAASNALSLLHEHLPPPDLPTDPDALMASSVEPEVTAARVTVRVPTSSIPHFGVLNEVLVSAVAAAHDDRLLSPPTQPEMAEMRAWLCGEIVGQTNAALPTPWRPRTDVRAALGANAARAHAYRELAASEESLIATDDTSVIVAVTPDVVDFLGYRDEADLIGRRVLAVVPARFHQAHIAGTTLHVTNGRDVLLDQWLTVPVVRADGSEVPVGLHVTSRLLAGDVRVFVAHLRLHDASFAPA